MAITRDDFKKVWASTSSVPEYTFSDTDYKNGWEFVGNLPPTRAMWDELQRKNDEKMQFLQENGSMCFDSVTDMKSSNLDAGQTAFTKGYYSINDGGAGVYSIRGKVAGETEDGGSVIFLANGNVAELIVEDTVDLRQFGAIGDGVTDSSIAVRNCFTFADGLNITGIGTFVVNTSCTTGAIGLYNADFIIEKNHNLNLINTSKAIVSNCIFHRQEDFESADNRGQFTLIVNSPNATITNCEFYDTVSALAVGGEGNVSAVISGCYFHNILQTEAGAAVGGNGYGILATSYQNLSITNCTFEDVTRHAIYISVNNDANPEAEMTTPIEHVEIRNNRFIQSDRGNKFEITGYEVPINCRRPNYIVIENNYFENTFNGCVRNGNIYDDTDIRTTIFRGNIVRRSYVSSIHNWYSVVQDLSTTNVKNNIIFENNDIEAESGCVNLQSVNEYSSCVFRNNKCYIDSPYAIHTINIGYLSTSTLTGLALTISDNHITYNNTMGSSGGCVVRSVFELTSFYYKNNIIDGTSTFNINLIGGCAGKAYVTNSLWSRNRSCAFGNTNDIIFTGNYTEGSSPTEPSATAGANIYVEGNYNVKYLATMNVIEIENFRLKTVDISSSYNTALGGTCECVLSKKGATVLMKMTINGATALSNSAILFSAIPEEYRPANACDINCAVRDNGTLATANFTPVIVTVASSTGSVTIIGNTTTLTGTKYLRFSATWITK